jgi:hypothetical protein
MKSKTLPTSLVPPIAKRVNVDLIPISSTPVVDRTRPSAGSTYRASPNVTKPVTSRPSPKNKTTDLSMKGTSSVPTFDQNSSLGRLTPQTLESIH